ncbi:hypothetical protein SNOG_10605 [Parastagonospora nodorum SN15]|uniref:Uncharacterized protein n=1 Tax=Phaeosphaeria nodorum (strain SN15 / ATCC MYA-4574 / FGSC 10173) TaxID=321614 RepID=Q0UCA9_PHANO|nr:hypothetical protein SNOG_10605 [Parastagonospora nodorum SN15]EAT81999.1 hypothetical protein SNOG_10605 [Parastagonospora nodorum SN15]
MSWSVKIADHTLTATTAISSNQAIPDIQLVQRTLNHVTIARALHTTSSQTSEEVFKPG